MKREFSFKHWLFVNSLQLHHTSGLNLALFSLAENRCPGNRGVLRTDVWHFQKFWVRVHPLLPVQRLNRCKCENVALWKSGLGRRRGLGYVGMLRPPLQTLLVIQVYQQGFAPEHQADRSSWCQNDLDKAQHLQNRSNGSLEALHRRPPLLCVVEFHAHILHQSPLRSHTQPWMA